MTFWVSRIYLTWPFSTLWRFKSTLWLYKQNIFWNLTTPSHPVSTDPLTTNPSLTHHPHKSTKSTHLTFWPSESHTVVQCLVVTLGVSWFSSPGLCWALSTSAVQGWIAYMYEECVLQIRERPDRSNQRLLACEEQLGNWLGHERIHQGDEYNTDLWPKFGLCSLIMNNACYLMISDVPEQQQQLRHCHLGVLPCCLRVVPCEKGDQKSYPLISVFFWSKLVC